MVGAFVMWGYIKIGAHAEDIAIGLGNVALDWEHEKDQFSALVTYV